MMQQTAPKICVGCTRLNVQHEEDMNYAYPSYYYCEAGLWLPKKDNCKRKKEFKPRNLEVVENA